MPGARNAEPSVRDELCAALAGTLEAPLSPARAAAVIALARAERIDGVLAWALREPDALRFWPPAAAAALAEHLRQHLVLESMRQRELVQVVEAFAAAAIDVLLLKGAGLAYTIYPAPHLRPRDDTDLFIRRDDLDRAARALAACGFERIEEPDAELASTQRHYTRIDAAGLRHIVDLHWRVAIPRVFADTLAFDELWPRALAVPALAAAARTCEPADALLVACLHRVAHHHDAPHLLWLWDIHLLAGRLDAREQGQLAAAAARAGLCGVCVRGLQLAREHFGTPIDSLAAALEAARGSVEEGPSAFVGGLRPIDVLRSDLRALPGVRLRLRLLREHLFPPVAHMRAISGPRAFLPLVYVRRILRGAPAWFKRPGSGT